MYDYNLSDLGQRFDVIYIDPPVEEYQRRVSGINFPQKPWGFEEVSGDKPSALMDTRTHAWTHARTHTHTRAHTHAHAHTHTYCILIHALKIS